MQKAVKRGYGYIESNKAFIPNHCDRYRHKETISTAFVESAVNYVVSKRFVKKTADPLDPAWRSFIAADTGAGLKWRFAKIVLPYNPKMKLDQTDSVQEPT